MKVFENAQCTAEEAAQALYTITKGARDVFLPQEIAIMLRMRIKMKMPYDSPPDRFRLWQLARKLETQPSP